MAARKKKTPKKPPRMSPGQKVKESRDFRRFQLRIGGRLRELRMMQDLSQEKLDRASGVGWRMILNIEKGESNPTILTLYRLADALGVDPRELLAPAESRVRRRSEASEES